MEINVKENDSGALITYNGNFTIHHAVKLKESIMKHIGRHSNLTLDLKGVGRIDSAGFQLLMLARREAEKTGKNINIKNPKNEVRRIFDLYKEKLENGDS